MNEGCKEVLRRLIQRRCWGAKHLPEHRTIQWVKTRKDRKEFVKDYKKLIRDELILRQKKTQEWHISLNPRKKKEIHECMQQ